MANENTKETKKVQSVTGLPGWVLKLKGRLDSRKGTGVCDEYIRRLHKKLVSMETNEVIAVEEKLFEVRKEAAALLLEILERKERYLELPQAQKENSVEAIRMNRRNHQQKESLETGVTDAVKKLTVINEVIVNAETLLDERIHKLRSGAAEKIHIYVAGIRCGKLKDYEYDMNTMDDSAREIYGARHARLDEKIRSIVDFDIREEELS